MSTNMMADKFHKVIDWEVKLHLVSRIISGEKLITIAREQSLSRDTLHRWKRELETVAQTLWTGGPTAYRYGRR